jgi:hypothetical protein
VIRSYRRSDRPQNQGSKRGIYPAPRRRDDRRAFKAAVDPADERPRAALGCAARAVRMGPAARSNVVSRSLGAGIQCIGRGDSPERIRTAVAGSKGQHAWPLHHGASKDHGASHLMTMPPHTRLTAAGRSSIARSHGGNSTSRTSEHCLGPGTILLRHDRFPPQSSGRGYEEKDREKDDREHAEEDPTAEVSLGGGKHPE